MRISFSRIKWKSYLEISLKCSCTIKFLAKFLQCIYLHSGFVHTFTLGVCRYSYGVTNIPIYTSWKEKKTISTRAVKEQSKCPCAFLSENWRVSVCACVFF